MNIAQAGTVAVMALLAGAAPSQAQQGPASSAASTASRSSERTTGSAGNATIVLVHGAFADATGWQDLIALLQQDGYKVIAVQNPLTALELDVASTKRVIDAQTGPVVLVGHSYGGAVISGAGAGNPNVKALVYIAAFAPDAGEPVGAFLEKYPSPLLKALVPDAAGFVYIDTEKYRDVFAGDLPLKQTQVMAVTQKPASGALFGQANSVAAWKTIPSWYVVAQQDRAIDPDLERFYAKRMNARTSEIKASHLPFISQSREVVRVVREAAESAIR